MSQKLPYGLEHCDIRFRTVPTSGISLNVAEAGEGPLVFLLHGFPECWASWGPQIKFLVDKGYRVVAPEMRGYGDSDAPKDVTGLAPPLCREYRPGYAPPVQRSATL